VSGQSPIGNLTPRELQRQLEAERAGLPFLVYRDEGGELVLRPLEGDAVITLGRGEGVDVRIAWDSQVSQLHAELRPLGGEWLVVDDGLSRNGTFVDGERVAGRRRLRERDLLRVGATLILFRQPGAEDTRGETEMAVAGGAPDLTPTQRKVLIALCRPLAEGSAVAAPATNSAIAGELYLSVDAVKAHLRALFDRFEIADLAQNQKRIALADRAISTGAVTPRELRDG
jgi:pSer/pThr/pTyr-binding forkhead associated (FHA) protein